MRNIASVCIGEIGVHWTIGGLGAESVRNEEAANGDRPRNCRKDTSSIRRS